MADFDLIQTDAQVQSILNDGQNMQGAGAQTTLTTESVLLKDVNGNYHKILKSSFTEAIRDTLAGLLVNNDKGTTINQIAAIASGDFGSITPANLASVLGGLQDKGTISASTSLDTVTSVGTYSLPNNHVDSPISGRYGIMAVYMSSAFTVQLVTSANDSTSFIRVCWGGVWKQWQRLDNFDCNTPEALASLLGGLPYRGELNRPATPNNSTEQGVWYVYSNFMQQTGFNGEGLFYVYRPITDTTDGHNAICIQIFVSYDGTLFKRRVYNWESQTWTVWKDM